MKWFIPLAQLNDRSKFRVYISAGCETRLQCFNAKRVVGSHFNVQGGIALYPLEDPTPFVDQIARAQDKNPHCRNILKSVAFFAVEPSKIIFLVYNTIPQKEDRI